MEMSIKQYIDNPMGKRNAVFSQRDVFKKLYTEKFDKLILREAGKINFTLYMDKSKDQYVAHIKVPSETVTDFYYDAVFLFYSNDPTIKASPSLQDYSVKFFSNDPAFVFTYMRVFLKNDLLFEDLKSKSSKLALNNDPKEKNPYQVPGYSKILYFAYLFMKSKNLLTKSMYNSYAEKYSKSKLLSNVEHTDDKLSKRQELGAEESKKKAKEKKNKPQHQPNTSQSNNSSASGNVKISKTTQSTKIAGRARTTKITNKIKRK